MRVGILSDTHDHIDALIPAIEILRGRGVEHYFHCGDVGGTRVLDLLAGLPCTVVWGNNDFDVASLEAYGKTLGIDLGPRFVDLELGGKRFAVLHGDDGNQKRQVIDSGEFDYLLQGHTHVYTDARFGRTRLINPGALYRATPKTVVCLDTDTDELERIVVGR